MNAEHLPALITTRDPIEILRAVARAIHEEPRRYDQSIWMNTEAEDVDYPPACGTVACIAGWTLLLTQGHQNLPRGYFNIETAARDILGLDEPAADRLFDGSAAGAPPFKPWDTHSSRSRAVTPEQHAAKGVDHITRFLINHFDYHGPVL